MDRWGAVWLGRGELTLEICALLLSKVCAGLLHPRGQRRLDVLGHLLLGLGDGPGPLGVADHLLDALDGAMAVMKAAGDGLGQALYLCLLGLLVLVVVEAGQDVLLVQLLQAVALSGDVGQ